MHFQNNHNWIICNSSAHYLVQSTIVVFFLQDFGVDTGFDNNNVPENNPCQSSRNDNHAYTNEYPMAVYYSGQKVVIAHPTKVLKLMISNFL